MIEKRPVVKDPVEIVGSYAKYTVPKSEIDEMRQAHKIGINFREILSRYESTKSIITNYDILAAGRISVEFMV